jgi:ABC-type cobalamin/Fe3+-siderophores transport system ATPase subunit
MLCKESKADEFKVGIQKLRKIQNSLSQIADNFAKDSLVSKILDFAQQVSEIEMVDLSPLMGVVKYTIMGSEAKYEPSEGEKGILLLQKILAEESNAYILDEPELGMGNSYVNNTIIPVLASLGKSKKIVIIATHNANIAVRLLPYMSIFRTHFNGQYSTYKGNPFCDELVNIDNDDDMKNWTVESMHTLEGGHKAFYERKIIYESGNKDN